MKIYTFVVAPPRKVLRRRNGAVAISSDPVTSPAGGIDYFQQRENPPYEIYITSARHDAD